jgi:hydrogenase/urease accessory protein HupE
VRRGALLVLSILLLPATALAHPQDTSPQALPFVDMVTLGVHHIFTGFDHLAFLVALLLLAATTPRPLRATLLTVTAFTVAHSITLIAGALGWVTLPAQLVESVIAASIVWVAIENLLVRRAPWRWPLVFLFGLVHGLGFASMLVPFLPADGVVVPLLAFNLGVEIGQLAVVAVALPLLAWLAGRWPDAYRRVVVRGGSLIIGALGALWLVERLRG